MSTNTEELASLVHYTLTNDRSEPDPMTEAGSIALHCAHALSDFETGDMSLDDLRLTFRNQAPEFDLDAFLFRKEREGVYRL